MNNALQWNIQWAKYFNAKLGEKKTSSLISMPHLQVFDESETENYSTGGQCKLWQSLSLDIVLIQDVNWFSVVTSLYIKQKNYLRWWCFFFFLKRIILVKLPLLWWQWKFPQINQTLHISNSIRLWCNFYQ